MPQVLFADDPERELGNAWCLECLDRGIYLHPWHNMFLSAAHTEAEIALALQATEGAFAALAARRAA